MTQMKLTNQEIVEYRDRIFATTELNSLQIIAAELLRRYGLQHAARQVIKGRAFIMLAQDSAAINHALRGLLLCCAAQLAFCRDQPQSPPIPANARI